MNSVSSWCLAFGRAWSSSTISSHSSVFGIHVIFPVIIISRVSLKASIPHPRIHLSCSGGDFRTFSRPKYPSFGGERGQFHFYP
jgi:hypothetical protein